jgi:uncharacterized protein (DUF1800 family)
MQLSRRDFLKDMAFAAAIAGLPNWMTDLDEAPPMEMLSLNAGAYPWQWTPSSDIGQGNPIITTLNRIAFGPRPGDFERVQQIGIDAYIEEQLAPEKIDDSTLDARLAQNYPTLKMSALELFQKYPQPAPGTKPQPSTTPQQVILELQEATVLRALYSQRQLQEMLVDFWSNHFSIFIGKNQAKWLKTVDDREVIRKNAFGKFKELLLASAQSPAMLEYLDNQLNVKGVANENYAREIMELHSLGVDGGYTQKDVAELARALTGWGYKAPRRIAGVFNLDGAGLFEFDPREHDNGAKRILGIDLPANGGINDGLKMIDVLAHHPSTARFIARKLVTRFVSDTPPDALVQRAAESFLKTDGDIRQVLSVILHLDEFKNSFAQKIKRPFELVVSALRAVDAQLEDARAIALALRAMGQGLFLLTTPDGYPDTGAAWINTSALLARWNYALLVGANRVPRGKIDFAAALKNLKSRTVGEVVDYSINDLLHRTIPEKDRQKLIDAFGGKPAANFDLARAPELVALILASPHFQYR